MTRLADFTDASLRLTAASVHLAAAALLVAAATLPGRFRTAEAIPKHSGQGPWHPIERTRDVSALNALPSAGPAPICGASLVLVAALPDPTSQPDREGELVRVLNPSADSLSLEGWTLGAGRSRRRLEGVVVAPHDHFDVGGDGAGGRLAPVRLANRGGCVELRDPCGTVIDRRCWPGDAPPGAWVQWPDPRSTGPTRGRRPPDDRRQSGLRSASPGSS